jgi:hypothetical protein
MDTTLPDLARVRLLSAQGGTIRVAVPGSNYVFTLEAGPDAAQLRGREGRIVTGRVEARAMRLHRASGGGRFVEPLEGTPRIIQGLVRAVDAPGRRLLVEAATPIWLSLEPEDDPRTFAEGDLVNGYLLSGAKFVPESA